MATETKTIRPMDIPRGMVENPCQLYRNGMGTHLGSRRNSARARATTDRVANNTADRRARAVSVAL